MTEGRFVGGMVVIRMPSMMELAAARAADQRRRTLRSDAVKARWQATLASWRG